VIASNNFSDLIKSTTAKLKIMTSLNR